LRRVAGLIGSEIKLIDRADDLLHNRPVPRNRTSPRPDIRPRSNGARPVRFYRLKLGLTQRRCAEIMGKSVRTWQAYEAQNFNPPKGWQLKLRDAVNRLGLVS